VPSEILYGVSVDFGVAKERSYSLLEGDRGGGLDSRDTEFEHENCKAAWLDAHVECCISRGKNWVKPFLLTTPFHSLVQDVMSFRAFLAYLTSVSFSVE
jgi:hypothetical protein